MLAVLVVAIRGSVKRAVLLALKEGENHTRLAELAIEYGFSDQAHMTRECQLIAGITPKRYINRKLLT